MMHLFSVCLALLGSLPLFADSDYWTTPAAVSGPAAGAREATVKYDAEQGIAMMVWQGGNAPAPIYANQGTYNPDTGVIDWGTPVQLGVGQTPAFDMVNHFGSLYAIAVWIDTANQRKITYSAYNASQNPESWFSSPGLIVNGVNPANINQGDPIYLALNVNGPAIITYRDDGTGITDQNHKQGYAINSVLEFIDESWPNFNVVTQLSDPSLNSFCPVLSMSKMISGGYQAVAASGHLQSSIKI